MGNVDFCELGPVVICGPPESWSGSDPGLIFDLSSDAGPFNWIWCNIWTLLDLNLVLILGLSLDLSLVCLVLLSCS